MKPGGQGQEWRREGRKPHRGLESLIKTWHLSCSELKDNKRTIFQWQVWRNTHTYTHTCTLLSTHGTVSTCTRTYTHTHRCTPKHESVAFMPLVKCWCRKGWFGCGATRQETSCPSIQKPAHKNAILQGPVPGLVLGKYVLAFAQLLP